MTRRALALVAIVGAFIGMLAGCASNEPRDRMVSVGGLATETTAVVELGKAPADPAPVLDATNEAVKKLLAERMETIVRSATRAFDSSPEDASGDSKERTRIEPASVEAVVETPLVRAENSGATRQELTGKTTHFRFTVRRSDAKLGSDPLRIEVPVTVLEDSRAPGDTIGFPQEFRAQLLEHIQSVVAEAARAKGCEPSAPRPLPRR